MKNCSAYRPPAGVRHHQEEYFPRGQPQQYGKPVVEVGLECNPLHDHLASIPAALVGMESCTGSLVACTQAPDLRPHRQDQGLGSGLEAERRKNDRA